MFIKIDVILKEINKILIKNNKIFIRINKTLMKIYRNRIGFKLLLLDVVRDRRAGIPSACVLILSPDFGAI